MDSRVILIQSIMLLYWESRLGESSGKSNELVKSLAEEIKLPEAALDNDPTRDILIGLRSIALNLASEVKSEPIDKDYLKQRLKICVRKDPDLLDILTEGMVDVADQSEIKLKCISYGKLLHSYKKERDFKDMIKKWTADIIYSHSDASLDVRQISAEMSQSLERFSMDSTVTGPMGIDGVVGMVDLLDKNSVAELLETAVEETGTEGVLKTGFQAINRMLGWHGGFRRGDTWVVGAMEHNFKTGFTLSILRHFALYNTPYMLDPTKKPLLLHISSENALTDNLLLIYQGFKENETGEACDITNINRDEATDYVMAQCAKNGYTLHMLRVNPSEFTYQSLMSLCLQYEADGYEIHVCMLDYLNMLNKAGCIQGAQGMDTRDLFRRTRNFFTVRKTLFITPHQISSDAKYLLRQGVEDFVKEIAGKAYWDSCKTIEQEVDGSILIHIEIVNGVSYLTVKRGKHRMSGPVTPEVHKYCVLPFHAVGAIRDDINGKDLSMRKIGSNVAAGSDANGGWFET